MPKVWTRQGVVDSATTSQETFEQAVRKIRDSLRQPSFIHDVERQTRAILWCQNAGHLGHPIAADVIRDLGTALAHIPPLRLQYILELKDPTEIRSALARSHTTPRPYTAEESIYPTDGWLGTYLAYARESNAPIGFHFWLGSALLGAALRRNFYLPLGYLLYPNHYLFVIGDSALGKSAAFNHATPILTRANHLVVEQLSQYIVGPDAPIPNLTVNVLSNDLTPERMIQAMVPQTINAIRRNDDADNLPLTLIGMDSTAALWNDELVTLAGKHKYGAGGVFQIITGLYTCPSEWSRATRGHGEEILIKPTLNFATASTLEWINSSISEDMFEGGFMSRCLITYREELGFDAFTKEPPIDPIAQHALAKMLVPWMMMQPRPITFTREADKLWGDMVVKARAQIPRVEDPRMRPYYERKKNHVGKVALTLVASRYTGDPETFSVEELQEHHSFLLTEDLLAQAIRLVEFEEQFLPGCFAKIGQHKDASGMDKLREYIAARNQVTRCPLPSRVVRRRANNIFGADANKIITLMETMGTIKSRLVRRSNHGPSAPEIWDPEILGDKPKKHWWDAEQRLERES